MELTFKKGFSWAIAYINRDHISRVQKDLSRYIRYRGIDVYIPTVKILRKQFKGKNIFEEIPLLFNYGFFNIPNKNLSVDFLQKLKEDIPCIHAWVKDPKVVITTKPALRNWMLEPLERRDVIPVALATKGEMQRILNAHKNLSIYDKETINKLKPGDNIKLTGYPFEGLGAKVISVDERRQKVKVQLELEGLMKDITISFDNVFYTVYHGPLDENDFKEKLLEDMKTKIKKNKFSSEND